MPKARAQPMVVSTGLDTNGSGVRSSPNPHPVTPAKAGIHHVYRYYDTRVGVSLRGVMDPACAGMTKHQDLTLRVQNFTPTLTPYKRGSAGMKVGMPKAPPVLPASSK